MTKKFHICSRLFLIQFVILGLLAGVSSAAGSATADLPFQPGERMLYKLSWGVIPAGFAELQVLPFAEINGEPTWHFVLSVRTSEFVDMFYRVRDRVESYTDLGLNNSLLYLKKQREGHTSRDVVVRLDPAEHSAVYADKGRAEAAIAIEDGTIDPLASLYYVRSKPLAEDIEVVKFVSDGKKNVLGVARIVGRENLLIDNVGYDTFVVEPDLKDVSGVFEKSSKSRLTLWITADERRLLVKVMSKVKVGSFTGTLVESNPPL